LVCTTSRGASLFRPGVCGGKGPRGAVFLPRLRASMDEKAGILVLTDFSNYRTISCLSQAGCPALRYASWYFRINRAARWHSTYDRQNDCFGHDWQACRFVSALSSSCRFPSLRCWLVRNRRKENVLAKKAGRARRKNWSFVLQHAAT